VRGTQYEITAAARCRYRSNRLELDAISGTAHHRPEIVDPDVVGLRQIVEAKRFAK
jgi:hypothetical protein